MKVYAAPENIAVPQFSFVNNKLVYDKTDEAYLEELKQHLISEGNTGKHTGDIVRFPMGDGYAQYMFADGRSCYLVHIPTGDAWDCRDAEFIPKKEILKRIEQGKKWAKLFSKNIEIPSVPPIG